jgi:hypothetical protein
MLMLIISVNQSIIAGEGNGCFSWGITTDARGENGITRRHVKVDRWSSRVLSERRAGSGSSGASLMVRASQ